MSIVVAGAIATAVANDEPGDLWWTEASASAVPSAG